jgi:exopolysaccharide biosynthesis polyprenyl glycosylphosphotransferase
MNNKLQALKYVVADYLSAGIAWALFFVFRKIYIEPQKFGVPVNLEFTEKFFYGLIIIPFVWVLVYSFLGTYSKPYRKSRLNELGQTLLVSFLGVVVVFFALLLDDQIANYKNYYISFSALFGFHFFFTFLFRFILSSSTAYRIHNRLIGFNTIIVGSNEKAVELFKDLESQKKSSGFKVLGFVHLNGNHNHMLEEFTPHLGHFNDIHELIKTHQIEEIICAIESSEHDKIGKIVSSLDGMNVYVKIIPDMYDILSGQVKMSSIFGAPLIDISKEIMPSWQKTLKRGIDIFSAIFALLLLSPLLIITAIIIVLTSKGPILYSHERIGLNGKPFRIFKFRSMVKNAEQNGPALSSKTDSRITPFGKFMRRTRIDEIPNFVNVLKGEMSLVGPRPERQFFIDQIVEKAPHYKHLHKIKPGITSWGQVKYGYAENVTQMVERLKYDIIYLENMSLFVDFKILIYTVLIVLQGRGK